MKITRFLSITALVSVIGYMFYNESRKPVETAAPPLTDVKSFGKSLPLPTSLSFAGESVPLDQPDVLERLDRELHINSYWHNNTIFLMKTAGRWFPAMEKILEEEGVPEDFKYLTAIEGNLRNDVSPKNAVGFWQIRKATGKELGLEVDRDVDERYDPLKSTRAACKYLKQAYKKFGSWTMVAASYNRGMAGMARAIADQNEDDYYDLMLNEETSRYVFRILAIKEIFEHPEKYSFDISQEHIYKPYDLQYVEVDASIDDLVAWAQEQGITYKTLKYYNPWLRRESLSVRAGKTYQIALPRN